ncbi:uncharacterized protein LOC117889903 isoform X3 [Drosophila subobscura]|uniref:uncharacterized protein LOC117889903 isoform X3 n=1 Tax=Drosophila subobscura TaxID=7241 RepID=UPI00155B0468|nr:uncharacterized protein LOC117889903 isoform X3 [Drosophila subobscura]
MQSQQVRPISTYDNLGAAAHVASSSKPHQQQQQQQLHRAGESPKQPERATTRGVSDQLLSNGMSQPQPQTELELEPEEELNGSGTSHSIAAVKAALNDAKSKFFGINNYDEYESAVQPTQMPMPVVKAHSQQPTIKPEPKYQNVPQRPKPQPDELPATIIEPVAMPVSVSSPVDRSLRYATTYEQIPLSDLDAPQPSQVSAVYMSTTVPQNIKGMKIAGRHTPTRNSLRHSRMIVVNHKNHDSVLLFFFWICRSTGGIFQAHPKSEYFSTASDNAISCGTADCRTGHLDTAAGAERFHSDQSVSEWPISVAGQYCGPDTTETGSPDTGA